MNKTVELIRYIQYNPMSKLSDITKKTGLSKAGFFRHRNQAKNVLGVEISFSNHGNLSGYEITGYGIIDRYKL